MNNFQSELFTLIRIQTVHVVLRYADSALERHLAVIRENYTSSGWMWLSLALQQDSTGSYTSEGEKGGGG